MLWGSDTRRQLPWLQAPLTHRPSRCFLHLPTSQVPSAALVQERVRIDTTPRYTSHRVKSRLCVIREAGFSL